MTSPGELWRLEGDNHPSVSVRWSGDRQNLFKVLCLRLIECQCGVLFVYYWIQEKTSPYSANFLLDLIT